MLFLCQYAPEIGEFATCNVPTQIIITKKSKIFAVQLAISWHTWYSISLIALHSDTDDDCAGDLVCFQRSANEPVRGCTGGDSDNSETDYCVMKETPASFLRPTNSPRPSRLPTFSSQPSISPAPSSNQTLAPSTDTPTLRPSLSSGRLQFVRDSDRDFSEGEAPLQHCQGKNSNLVCYILFFRLLHPCAHCSRVHITVSNAQNDYRCLCDRRWLCRRPGVLGKNSRGGNTGIWMFWCWWQWFARYGCLFKARRHANINTYKSSYEGPNICTQSTPACIRPWSSCISFATLSRYVCELLF